MQIILVILSILLLTIGGQAPATQAKVLGKCDIVDALNRHRFPRSFLSSCK